MEKKTEQPFVTDFLESPVGDIPRISAKLTGQDHWGSVKARLGIQRMNYKVAPGLYAIGEPDSGSEILVTANYKLSFDKLRKELQGLDFWVLVLDTDGINVWCAAGKKSFGTENLIHAIAENELAEIVSHRRLILPQLAAPGVSAHEVKRLSGFRVIYGPIMAGEINEFMKAGRVANQAMRRKRFPIWERMVLIPVELNFSLKISVAIMIIVGLFGGLVGPSGFVENFKYYGGMAAIWLTAAIIGGNFLTPALLPWIPGRAFAMKGIIPGLVCAVLAFYVTDLIFEVSVSSPEIIAWFILTVTASSFIAMNFTGASTYTSLSGVKKEMKWAIPSQIAGLIAAVILWISSLFGT
jgi:acetyl-CoA decarbonylase/synthase complex subunit gamma